MRVLIVLFGLVATPFLVGVSQGQSGLPGRGHDDAHCAKRLAQHPGKDINKCDPPVTQPPVTEPPVTQPPVTQPPVTQPPPPSFCQASGMSGGIGSVMGQVFVASTFVLQGDWCVHLLDPATGAVLASVKTSAVALDGEGNNWVFTNVPAGTYTVCEEPPLNETWSQYIPTSGPSCPGPLAVGLSAMLGNGGAADYLWFWNK